MYGTTVFAVSLFARVLVENPQLFKWSLLFKAFPGLIVMILGNSLYSGINQIYDADIDRVNKPYLPIPAGNLSLKQAWFLMTFYLLASLLILWLMNADLITTSIYCLTLLLDFFYSAPPIRFKKSPIATSMVNSVSGGILRVNGVLYATRASLGIPFQWSLSTVFISAFLTSFTVVIYNMKDLADVEGDIMHNIRTFPTIYGPRNTTFFCTGILLVNCIGAMVLAFSNPQAFKPYIMVPFHAHMALWVLLEVRKLDKANYTKEESAKFYQFLWKFISLELFVYPFI
ncbi:probable homogentisate phytyltransferase 2, chloroplastic [Morus notabilis]|uniref:probable homogentisate phytyltransferase 2, chloroplastic n=1 Tax=Morus notabilis TaxID=981085 RepID=UPI000CED0AE8|nr:probable homogentisate phytyltransferase 2, chloroplastic [Morus notabilis]